MAFEPVRIDDGFSTIIEFPGFFGDDPVTKLYEKEVTPPSLSGGGPVDVTTMRNIALRTQSPKKLKSVGNMQATVAYCSDALESLNGYLGIIGEIHVIFPDGAKIVFWGWMDSFTPASMQEGVQPTAVVVFIASNHQALSDVEETVAYTPPLSTEVRAGKAATP
jgi:hypothetical protein